MNWHTVDPNLPTLPFVFDDQAVRQHFTQQKSSSGTVTAWPTAVTKCRRQDVQYVPATRCVTTYAMTMEQPGAAPAQSIGVIEATPNGVNHRWFTADPHLPGMATASDSIAMRARLVDLRRQRGQKGVVDHCTVTPLRYKSNSRCALRYDLYMTREQVSCFGKVLAHDGTQLMQTVTMLYQASQQTPELPRIAEPLVYWPDLQLLLQAAVKGVELHTAAFDPQIATTTRLDWLRSVGRCIAALHSLHAPVYRTMTGAPRTFTDDLAELFDYYPALSQINLGLAGRFATTIAAIYAATQDQPEAAPVLSHGALRTDQFLIDHGQLVLIDLDGIGLASPARDLGNLFAYLTWKALRQPQHAAFIQAGQRAFLAGYSTLRDLPSAEWLALYQAASLLKIIGRRYTGLTYQEWPLTETLLDIAMEMVSIA